MPLSQLMLNLGLHGMVLTMNQSKTIDPRISAKYQINDQTTT